jgi:signal transduction histidine kinase
MKTNGFDIVSWIEYSQAECVLSRWDRERYAKLPTYREMRRDVALAHGRGFIEALAVRARGDVAGAEGAAGALVDDGAAAGCPPEEVVAAFRIFERAYWAELADSALPDAVFDRAEQQLKGALLGCSNALASALAARLADARAEVARVEAEAQRLREDRDQVKALLSEVMGAAMAALASTRGPDESPTVPAEIEAMERLRDRVERLRLVGRLENGVQLREARARVRDILADVARSWEDSARRQGIAISLDVDASEVSVDGDLLVRALGECLDNALRFTPWAGEIWLAGRQNGERIVISVWNSGPPLHPDQRNCVFDKYRTVGEETGAARGLGLYLCRLVAERHGGEVWTDDEDGCCAVHIALPGAAEAVARPNA